MPQNTTQASSISGSRFGGENEARKNARSALAGEAGGLDGRLQAATSSLLKWR